eukprot:MONOS_8024.1-p1 / transcript=MONOS_8024.1 / gene=MONOS_8024 / organism=Monocercomonoides_exilis_PA203 / gene_product=ATP-dependent RNA helicase DDX5/DBP2 / transcript_product=ATP-dependent RNA helicase DDX5/DBP2 / location=Mono_scaffold00291:47696-49536(-) / protein_length=399 / sequence_SO=supercontig / SO=protein_coding / is_pseudo=false
MGGLGSNLPQNIDFSDAPPVRKDFYVEHPETARLSENDVQWFYREHQVTAIGENIPKPCMKFEHANFSSDIMNAIARSGFKEPTLIQQISWPTALSGRDLIGIAETGSGKTLAFALPGITHLLAQPPIRRGDGPIMLVLAPTRELAVQIETEMRKYCGRVRTVCLYGGVSKVPQMRQLREGVEVVIATPGRLIDLISAQCTNLKRVTYLVIDEADRLLEMGFEEQLRKIVSQIRPDRQTLMWSATWPKDIRQLAFDFLNQKTTVRFHIGSIEIRANARVTQLFTFCSIMEKQHKLVSFLEENMRDGRILIFTDTKRMADELTTLLRTNGFPALSIHGDKSQGERDWVMAEFKSGRSSICIATDVASRGIDVSDIKYVINYDVPKNIEDYVHRIGRTARG